MTTNKIVANALAWNAKSDMARNAVSITRDSRRDDWWVRGTVNGLSFMAKVYDEPSGFGIDHGRVSKLEIRDKDDNIAVTYDRGWESRPKTAEMKKAYTELVKAMEKLANAYRPGEPMPPWSTNSRRDLGKARNADVPVGTVVKIIDTPFRYGGERGQIVGRLGYKYKVKLIDRQDKPVVELQPNQVGAKNAAVNASYTQGSDGERALAVMRRILNRPQDKVEVKKPQSRGAGFTEYEMKVHSAWLDKDEHGESPYSRYEKALRALRSAGIAAVDASEKIENDGSVSAVVRILAKNAVPVYASHGGPMMGLPSAWEVVDPMAREIKKFLELYSKAKSGKDKRSAARAVLLAGELSDYITFEMAGRKALSKAGTTAADVNKKKKELWDMYGFKDYSDLVRNR